MRQRLEESVAKLSDEQLDEELRGAGLQKSLGEHLADSRGSRHVEFSCNVTVICELRKRRNN